MKITIFGATGGIGRHALDQAIAAGHQVTAVVRDSTKMSGDVRVVEADLAAPDPSALQSAVEGADAVLSCLGPRSMSEVGIASLGTRAVIEAMQAALVQRVVIVSAAPIGTVPSPDRPNPPKHDPGDGFFIRLISRPLKAVLRKAYADLALMEDVVRESGLEWTIIRPPRLTNGPLTGEYRTAFGRNLRRGLTVSRADVAHLMLRVLGGPEAIKEVIGVAS
jgi:putative NADH-flavin reductase